ncbi:MAG TPA: neutral zinc metallopeptidase [Burkholderiales bacterium]|nr:neutral zinc metallopeptidase [Burkholderiales bacterium]
MRLGDQDASNNVEDRRGMGIGGGIGVGGLVIAVIAYFLGFDPSTVLNVAQQVAPQSDTRQAPTGAPGDAMGQFVAKVLGSTEVVWGRIFAQSNVQYRAPTLVLFDNQVRSACGMAQSATGPFYCPGDEKLYIDLSFFHDMQTRFHTPGDFAEAYVIAHEVGHHIQKLNGTFQKVEATRGRVSRAEANRISVRMELQADCLAGVWGYHAGTMNQLESGDIAEALNAATAIGDDRLQQQTQGRVVPESFTHGSSAQRVRWFKRGMESGRPQDCNTFSSGSL